MKTCIGNHTSRTNFDEVVLPHLDAAHRLARWLTRNEHDAEDAVQEASLRAFRSLRTFSGINARAWFLRIVRNTCYGSFGRRPPARTDVFDEEQHTSDDVVMTPETLMLQADDALLIERSMGDLPDRFRELLVLREVEGLSYKELAKVFGIPIGTVMSGLSRARQAFQRALSVRLEDTNRQSSPRASRPPKRTRAVGLLRDQLAIRPRSTPPPGATPPNRAAVTMRSSRSLM